MRMREVAGQDGSGWREKEVVEAKTIGQGWRTGSVAGWERYLKRAHGILMCEYEKSGKEEHMDKRIYVLFLVAAAILALAVSPASAVDYTVDGKPLSVAGYITQGGQFSLADQSYHDTEQDLQGALFNFFVETNYGLSPKVKFYTSGMFTADWVYDIKSSDGSWQDKEFDGSRKQGMYIDNQYWQLLKEAHLTWSEDNFMLRVGKQSVGWGETDMLRLMDQINPLDQRRSFAETEIDTLRIPVWLLRFDYYTHASIGKVQDINFQGIFNPNVTFIRDQVVTPGNDVAGVWAPNVSAGLFKDLSFLGVPGVSWVPASIADNPLIFPPFLTAGLPAKDCYVGSMQMKIKKVNSLSSEGFEYGIRVKASIYDALVSLSYFYGLDKSPITRGTGASFTVADDGNPIVHPVVEGFYPLFRFVGATFSKDILSLAAPVLGGVAPVIRLETFYAFSNTFVSDRDSQWERHDEFRWMLGADWKVKIPLLNPRAYFMISPQFYHQKILDYPSTYTLTSTTGPVRENNYTGTLNISTSYFHNKLAPSFFWYRFITERANMFRYQIAYDHSDKWHYSIGAYILNGEKSGRGFDPMDHKDNFFFKVTYRWS
jgi:hypothetical protein